ncbi:CU044_5270 family protein [Streptomyces plumbiresistens]|uniref:CU044_5270 family protein n=1 Tax=Streptomyces plumbiresistens TaxID=511811 RepID=A0ABP7SJ74_9ACTN
MDEMTAVRELRAEAPAAERAPFLAGRDRLLREATGRSRARRLRADWRLMAAATAALITAVALIGTQVIDRGPDGVRPGARPGYTLELGSAKDLLNDAADAIAAGPAVTARDGQWIYVKSVETNLTDDEKPGPQTDEDWYAYADPKMEDGKAGDDHSPREEYAFLKNLPDDPAQVRAKARAFFYATDKSESRTQHEYRALTAVLSRAYAYDPAGLAKVYRALATIPGVQAAEVQDEAGRSAYALYRTNAADTYRDEVLLDPATYLYAGYRHVARTGDLQWDKGDVVLSGARLVTAVVDEKGERP